MKTRVTVRKSISLPRRLFAAAEAKRQDLALVTFSDYIQALILRDSRKGGK